MENTIFFGKETFKLISKEQEGCRYADLRTRSIKELWSLKGNRKLYGISSAVRQNQTKTHVWCLNGFQMTVEKPISEQLQSQSQMQANYHFLPTMNRWN